jgi:hypothetical protein
MRSKKDALITGKVLERRMLLTDSTLFQVKRVLFVSSILLLASLSFSLYLGERALYLSSSSVTYFSRDAYIDHGYQSKTMLWYRLLINLMPDSHH